MANNWENSKDTIKTYIEFARQMKTNLRFTTHLFFFKFNFFRWENFLVNYHKEKSTIYSYFAKVAGVVKDTQQTQKHTHECEEEAAHDKNTTKIMSTAVLIEF